MVITLQAVECKKDLSLHLVLWRFAVSFWFLSMVVWQLTAGDRERDKSHNYTRPQQTLYTCRPLCIQKRYSRSMSLSRPLNRTLSGRAIDSKDHTALLYLYGRRRPLRHCECVCVGQTTLLTNLTIKRGHQDTQTLAGNWWEVLPGHVCIMPRPRLQRRQIITTTAAAPSPLHPESPGASLLFSFGAAHIYCSVNPLGLREMTTRRTPCISLYH